MKIRRFNNFILILALLSLAVGQEWFEQGHLAPLTVENFDSQIHQLGKYKFVKFYTRSCRYCRLLKQVEEQLRQEKEWGFRFYDVDCTIHYEFCQSRVSISAFPYVGVYNIKGQLEGHIGGYYPIDTMRQAFNAIEQRQIYALAALKPSQMSINNQAVSQPSTKTAQLHTVTTPSALPTKNISQIADPITQKPKEAKHVNKTHESNSQKPNKKVSKGEWDSQISDGIKICVILFGIWMYGKTVKPYLVQSESSYPKSRIIEIPIGRRKYDEENAKDENSPLMNDVL